MTFKFVRVLDSGVEEPISLDEVEAARQFVREWGGHGVCPTVPIRGEIPTTRIEAGEVLAIIHRLSSLPRYRGARIDAVEVTPPH